MLDYSKFDHLWGFDYDKVQDSKAQYVLDEIKKRQEFLKAKRDQIDQLNYEANLITGNICNVIRDDLWGTSKFNMFYGINDEAFWKAWRYFNHHKDKDFEDYKDPKTKKEEKQSLDFIDGMIRHYIFTDKDEAKLVECLSYCYGMGYDFTYSYKGETIQVYIPLFQKTTGDNYLDMLHGYRLNFKESEYSWGWIAGGLEYMTLKDKLDEWLAKRHGATEMHEIDEETAKQLQEELMKNAKPTGVKID